MRSAASASRRTWRRWSRYWPRMREPGLPARSSASVADSAWFKRRRKAMLHTDLIAPISELLQRHGKERSDKVAYWDAQRSVTYGGLARRTASMAVALSKRGVREGDRIAIYLPNGVDWIEACFAGLRAGAVIVPISFEAAEGEISYRLTDASCGTVV